MKKLLYCAAALGALLFAGSCQRENLEPAAGSGTVTFTVTAPGEIQTKVIADGENVNEVHYAVYKTNDNEPNALSGTDGPLAQGLVEMANKKATVELELLQDQDYTILFWAQVKDAGHYEIGDLRTVSMKTVVDGNDESRAAFFARYDFNTEKQQNYEVTLYRPFAQLNLGTTEASLKPSQQGQTTGYNLDVLESEVVVKGLSTTFSLVDGRALEESATFTFESSPTPAKAGEKLTVNNVLYHYLAMNYLFVPASDNAIGDIDPDNELVEVSYEITTDKGVVENTIQNVPVRQNYRTNIIGNLLTSKTEFEIVVDNRFIDDATLIPNPDINLEVWDGHTTIAVTPDEDGVYNITNAYELAWVAEQVNIGNTFKDKTVKITGPVDDRLHDSIDLGGKNWTPIGITRSEDYKYMFEGTFDGNNIPIRNLTVTTHEGAGLFGYVHHATIKNVIIDGFDITTNHWAGALIGWAEQGAGNVVVTRNTVKNGKINCAVELVDGGVYDNGDKAGSIVGYAWKGEYTDNTAENVTITAYRDLGGIAGYYLSSDNQKFKNNTVTNVVLVQNLENGYKIKPEDINTVGKYVGKLVGNITDDNTEAADNATQVAEGLAVGKEEVVVNGQTEEKTVGYVTNEDGFKTLAGLVNEGEKVAVGPVMKSASDEILWKNIIIKLTSDIDLEDEEWAPIGTNEHHFTGTFDGQGYTIRNFKITKRNSGHQAALFGTVSGSPTFRNINIEGAKVVYPNDGGDFYGAALVGTFYGNLTVENVTVKNSYISGNNKVAGLLAHDGVCSSLNIDNCHVTDSEIESLNANDGGNVGGLIGLFQGVNEKEVKNNPNYGKHLIKNSSVRNCVINGVNSTNTGKRSNGEFVACISGKEGQTLRIENCAVSGNTFTQNEGVTYVSPYGTFVGGNREDNGLGTVIVDGYIMLTDGVSVKEDESDYRISNLAGLKWFAKEVNAGTTFSKKTVNLVADVDLINEEWTPIGTGEGGFTGVFDGQGHTISNLKITGYKSTVGLFANTYNGEIKNLTINNAKVSGRLNVGVVAGNPYTSKYTNIQVTGHVEVNGMAYVGGVGGKNAYADWTNIAVDVDETSYVKANSVENGTAYRTYVGGVCGFNGEGVHSFTNITSNIDVTGSTIDVGGLFGIAHYGNKFENCSCSGDVEITDAADAADAEEIGGIAGVWHNGGADVVFTNCSFTGTLKTNITEGVDLSDNTITGKAYSSSGSGKLIIDGYEMVAAGVTKKDNVYEISSVAGLYWVADQVNVQKNPFKGQTVKLVAEMDLENADWEPIGQTGKTEFKGVFDGNNHTIYNLNIDSDAEVGSHYSSALFGWLEGHNEAIAIKNLYVDGAKVTGHHNCAAVIGYMTGSVVAENIHVKNAAISCTMANSEANGDKAGVVIGNGTAQPKYISNCTATDSSVSAGRDAGQIVGAAKESKVTDCAAYNVSVKANGTSTGANVRNDVIGRLLL